MKDWDRSNPYLHEEVWDEHTKKAYPDSIDRYNHSRKCLIRSKNYHPVPTGVLASESHFDPYSLNTSKQTWKTISQHYLQLAVAVYDALPSYETLILLEEETTNIQAEESAENRPTNAKL